MSLLVILFYPLLPGWRLKLPGEATPPSWAWSVGIFIAAYFMYVNYAKLLRRQNDHIFRSFFVSASNDVKVNDSAEIVVPSVGT